MKPILVVATRNPGKLAEIRALVADLPLEVRDAGDMPEVEETGATFAENAEIKARAAARHFDAWALADDSGLEVDALGGEPGVLSARYGAPDVTTDAGRCRLLLAKMENVPDEARTARFRCAVAIASPDGRLWIREGSCEGVIARAPRGSGGFGYDPIFILPSQGRTMAELPPETKNRLSHRAHALAEAREVLEHLLGG